MRSLLTVCLPALVLACVFISVSSLASVKDESDRLAIGLVTDHPDFAFQLASANVDNETYVTFRPNTRGLSGFMASAFGLSVSYKTLVEEDPEEEILKGKTSYEDLRASFYLGTKKRFAFSGYYNRYKGFYIENSTEVDPSLSASSPKLQRPDLEISNVGASLLYIFDPSDYSGAAAFSQSARQTSSGGSWLASVSLDSTRFNADSALIPSQVNSEYGEDATIYKGTQGTMAASFGYGHTFAWQNLYFTLKWMLGKGYQQGDWTTASEKADTTTNSTKIHMGLGLGYNGENLFTGLAYQLNQTTYKARSLNIHATVNSGSFFLGWRFD